MKKWLMMLWFVGIFIFSFAFASAERCKLDATLLNQDPYPAVPGDYVKIVIQLSGLGNPECGLVSFELAENFPFSLDPGASNTFEVDGGTYLRNFESSLLIPYEVRVDENALDGDNTLEAALKYRQVDGGEISLTEEFTINVEQVETDFEVSVSDYDSATNTLTFEILNVGENDVEALVIEIPKQENIEVKGNNREIVGDLDSAEDTTFKFEAIPKDGEMELIIYYNDQLSNRRMVSTKVGYDSSYFTDRIKDKANGNNGVYYFLGFLVLIVGLIIWWRIRKKKKLERYNKSGKR